MTDSTNKRFVCDLNELVKHRTKKNTTLPDAPSKGSIGSSSGIAYESETQSSAGGAGWPLTETSRTETTTTLTSDDGLVEVDVADCTSITFEDANGDERIMYFNPPART